MKHEKQQIIHQRDDDDHHDCPQCGLAICGAPFCVTCGWERTKWRDFGMAAGSGGKGAMQREEPAVAAAAAPRGRGSRSRSPVPERVPSPATPPHSFPVPVTPKCSPPRTRFGRPWPEGTPTPTPAKSIPSPRSPAVVVRPPLRIFGHSPADHASGAEPLEGWIPAASLEAWQHDSGTSDESEGRIHRSSSTAAEARPGPGSSGYTAAATSAASNRAAQQQQGVAEAECSSDSKADKPEEEEFSEEEIERRVVDGVLAAAASAASASAASTADEA